MVPLQEITRQVSEAFEPTRYELTLAVKQRQDFEIVCTGIMEDGEAISWLGLSCERTDGALPECVLGIVCVLMRPPGATRAIVSARVSWSRGWSSGGVGGFAIDEAKQPSIEYVDPSSVATLAGHFPQLREAFLSALERGKPLSRFQARWRQLFLGHPAPQYFG